MLACPGLGLGAANTEVVTRVVTAAPASTICKNFFHCICIFSLRENEAKECCQNLPRPPTREKSGYCGPEDLPNPPRPIEKSVLLVVLDEKFASYLCLVTTKKGRINDGALAILTIMAI